MKKKKPSTSSSTTRCSKQILDGKRQKKIIDFKMGIGKRRFEYGIWKLKYEVGYGNWKMKFDMEIGK